jgi:hypothetical protein
VFRVSGTRTSKASIIKAATTAATNTGIKAAQSVEPAEAGI